MREIKFRAWDKEDKKMWKVVSITESIWGDCEEAHIRVCELHENPSKKETDVRMSVDYELMQYTGLKDKNGKEIFEGDFVHIHIPIIGSEIIDFFGTVKFYEGAFWVDDNEDAIPLWSEINIPFIVGNVYENPELMEEQQNGTK